MNSLSGHRRGSARSASEPPQPGPWALRQPPSPSAVPVSIVVDGVDEPSSHHQGAGGDLHPSRPTLQINTGRQRGRQTTREMNDASKVPPVSVERRVPAPSVEAGLDSNSLAGRSSKRRPSEIITSNPPRVRDHSLPTGGTPTISPYVPRFTYATTNPHGAAPPPSSNGNPAPPTFWIPFTLAPGAVPGSMARLTPINRRVPAHLRAAASALNLKMMYPLQSGTNPFAMDRPTQPAPAPAAVPAATSSRSRESKSRNDAATASGGGSGGVTSTSRPADPSFNFESSRTRKSKLEVSSTIDGKDRRQRSSASSPLPQAEVESRPEPPREKETVVERAPSPKVEIQETVVDDVVDKAAETEVVVEAIEDCGKESEVTEVGHVDPNFQIVVDPILVPVEIEHTEAEGVHTILTPVLVVLDPPKESNDPDTSTTILPEDCIIASSLPSAIPNDLPETIEEEVEPDLSFETEPETRSRTESLEEECEEEQAEEVVEEGKQEREQELGAESEPESEKEAEQGYAAAEEKPMTKEQDFEQPLTDEVIAEDQDAEPQKFQLSNEEDPAPIETPLEVPTSDVPNLDNDRLSAVNVKPTIESAVEQTPVLPSVEVEPLSEAAHRVSEAARPVSDAAVSEEPAPLPPRPARPRLTIRTSSTSSSSSAPIIAPVPPPSQNGTAYSTIRHIPSDASLHSNSKSRKRSSLRQSVDVTSEERHIPESDSRASQFADNNSQAPKAFVGAPRLRSNTVVDAPHLSIQPHHSHSTTVKPSSHSTVQRPQNASRPSAMRKVHAQLNAQKATDSAHSTVDAELDTDGEPSWAWDELIRQLDEEDELKSKLRTYYRPTVGVDGKSQTNIDAWWIAFQLAWEANMLRDRGVRTWWDIERHWRPSDMVFDDDDNENPAEENAEEAGNVDVEESSAASEPIEVKEKPVGASTMNQGGEETLVSSPEHSPRRSESRNSMKTLAGPNTNQSKRGSAPGATSSSSAGQKKHANIPEESAGHTTPTSTSSSSAITSEPISSHLGSGSASVPQPAATLPTGADTRPKESKSTDEPTLRTTELRNMWEEAEARWAKEEKENAKVAESSKPASENSPEPQPQVATADERERARSRAREERRARANTATAANTRPPILQRETFAGASTVEAEDASRQQEKPTRPSMFTRRQSEPSVPLAPKAPSSSSGSSGSSGEATGSDNDRRGRNTRPKLHIDTELTDYTKSKARAAPPPRAQPQPQPQVKPQPQPQPSRPQTQAHPHIHQYPSTQQPSKSQSRPSYPQTHSQAKPQSRSQSTNAKPTPKPAPPPVILRAIPQRAPSRVALAWKAYESRWESMLSHQSRDVVSFSSLPWPVLDPPKAYTSNPSDLSTEGDGMNALNTLAIAQFLLSPDHSGGVNARDRLRAAIRRWHSDKFSRFEKRMKGSGDEEGGDGEEKRRIMEGVGVVARSLTQLLEMERGD